MTEQTAQAAPGAERHQIDNRFCYTAITEALSVTHMIVFARLCTLAKSARSGGVRYSRNQCAAEFHMCDKSAWQVLASLVKGGYLQDVTEPGASGTKPKGRRTVYAISYSPAMAELAKHAAEGLSKNHTTKAETEPKSCVKNTQGLCKKYTTQGQKLCKKYTHMNVNEYNYEAGAVRLTAQPPRNDEEIQAEIIPPKPIKRNKQRA